MVMQVNRLYSTYSEYLKHPNFLSVKRRVLERDGGECVFCRQPSRVVHHLRYPRWGTFDVPDNLITVCHTCHCVIEGKES